MKAKKIVVPQGSLVWYWRWRRIFWVGLVCKLLFWLLLGPVIYVFHDQEGLLPFVAFTVLVALGFVGCAGIIGARNVLRDLWKCPQCGKPFGFHSPLAPYPHHCQHCKFKIKRPTRRSLPGSVAGKKGQPET